MQVTHNVNDALLAPWDDCVILQKYLACGLLVDITRLSDSVIHEPDEDMLALSVHDREGVFQGYVAREQKIERV